MPGPFQPRPDFRSTFAVDKDGANQSLSGTDWTKLTAVRVLWDYHGDYDAATSEFVVPKDGIYSSDIQVRFTDFVNVKSVEVALFMYIDGVNDDYWFTLGKSEVDSDSDAHIGNSTEFDFRAGQRFYIAARLTKISSLLACSATLLGSDDYTAWGGSYTLPILPGQGLDNPHENDGSLDKWNT